MLKETIDAYAATLNKQWAHDRSKTVGASEIGMCARKVFWTKRGKKPDDDWTDQYGARVRGTIMEEAFWYPALKARYGDNLIHAGPNQQTLVSGKLSATPDALIINQPYDALKQLGIPDIEGSCFMAEAKTIDPRTNIVEAKTENFFQVHVQLGLMRQLTDHQPVFNVLTYTDASFWSEVIEFPIKYDANIFEAAKSRANVIMGASDAAELPPEGWIAGGKECSFCPFVKPCGVERRSVPRENKKASPQFVAEISDYAREANTIKQLVLNSEKQQREIEQKIKDRMREKGVRRIQGVVNWYEVAAPVRYSTTKMKARLIELGEIQPDDDDNEFTKVGEPSDRLVIAAVPAVLPGVVMPGKLKPRKTKSANRKTKNDGKSKHTNKNAGRTQHATARAGRTHGAKPASGANRKSSGRKSGRR